jgi:hypothetical protein
MKAGYFLVVFMMPPEIMRTIGSSIARRPANGGVRNKSEIIAIQRFLEPWVSPGNSA